MTVKLYATSAVSGEGNPVTVSDWAEAAWTTMPDSVPVMLEFRVSVTVIDWAPAVLSVTGKV